MNQLNTLRNNKGPKIKYSMISTGYYEGRYKDVDIENKIEASKNKRGTKLKESNFYLCEIIPTLLSSDSCGTSVLFHQNLHRNNCREN